MTMMQLLFKFLVSRAQFMFIHVYSFHEWTPIRKLELTFNDDRKLSFSILHDRRKRNFFDFHVTYLIYIKILEDKMGSLSRLNNHHLLTLDVPFGFMFSDKIVANAILDNYLDIMIELLESKMH